MKCACIYFQKESNYRKIHTPDWCRYYGQPLDEQNYKFFHELNGIMCDKQGNPTNCGSRKIGQKGCLAQKQQLELFKYKDMDIEKVKKYAAEIATIISCSDLEIKQKDFKEFVFGDLLALMMICRENLANPVINDSLDMICLLQRLNLEFYKARHKEK